MSPHVAIVAVGTEGHDAVTTRMEGFASGLRGRDWAVERVSIDLPPSRVDVLRDRLPGPVRNVLEGIGAEGDVRPGAARAARGILRRLRARVAIVSVPPFSLLAAATQWLPAGVPLVIDYRDPWSTRASAPFLARVTRPVERRLLKRAAVVVYAGAHELGAQFVHNGVPANRVISVSNGFNPSDLRGVPPPQVSANRNGTPLDLVFVGYWYGRNGPGCLPQVLAAVGPDVARLTVIGTISPSIADDFAALTGCPPRQIGPLGRREAYRRLAQADIAVVTLDHGSAIESRLPAKVYDYLAVGVPVLAVCPPEARVLHTPGSERFHHFDHHESDALADFLRAAAAERAVLRPGPQGAGLNRDDTAEALDHALRLAIAEGDWHDPMNAPERG